MNKLLFILLIITTVTFAKDKSEDLSLNELLLKTAGIIIIECNTTTSFRKKAFKSTDLKECLKKDFIRKKISGRNLGLSQIVFYFENFEEKIFSGKIDLNPILSKSPIFDKKKGTIKKSIDYWREILKTKAFLLNANITVSFNTPISLYYLGPLSIPIMGLTQTDEDTSITEISLKHYQIKDEDFTHAGSIQLMEVGTKRPLYTIDFKSDVKYKFVGFGIFKKLDTSISNLTWEGY